MAEFDVDLFVIGGGSGGVRAARIAAGHGAARHDRRRIPDGRHLRDPRLRAEEAVRARPRISARRSRTPRASAGPFRRATFDWPTLIANKDKEIARLEAAYTTNVEKSGARSRQEPARCSRTPTRCVLRTGEDRHGQDTS